MNRSIIESAVVFIVVVAMYVLLNSLNLEKFNRRYAQGTPPIVKSNRLPFRFSLRTLLIATTLVAVVLGLGVWLAR